MPARYLGKKTEREHFILGKLMTFLESPQGLLCITRQPLLDQSHANLLKQLQINQHRVCPSMFASSEAFAIANQCVQGLPQYVCDIRLYIMDVEKSPCYMAGRISKQDKNMRIILEAIVDQSMCICHALSYCWVIEEYYV